ncbi:hypothetical protein JNM87_00110 [Candidatus Saccharibacteria bacterium]|nr:hypothetical protein [Candidatus Saccharibacteria bacterium]
MGFLESALSFTGEKPTSPRPRSEAPKRLSPEYRPGLISELGQTAQAVGNVVSTAGRLFPKRPGVASMRMSENVIRTSEQNPTTEDVMSRTYSIMGLTQETMQRRRSEDELQQAPQDTIAAFKSIEVSEARANVRVALTNAAQPSLAVPDSLVGQVVADQQQARQDQIDANLAALYGSIPRPDSGATSNA